MTLFITGRNEVVAKVMFLLVSVILLMGGGLPQCMLGYPPGADTPPRSRQSVNRGVCLSACWDTTPPPEQNPPPGSRLRHTVNERPVRILLECILVFYLF